MENDWNFLRKWSRQLRVSDSSSHRRGFAVVKETQAAARALEVQLQSLEVRAPNPILRAHFELRSRAGESAHRD